MSPCASQWALVITAAVVTYLVLRALDAGHVRRMHRVEDANGNEMLVVDARIGSHVRTLFLVDTAYAGAPVLSTSFLHVQDQCRWGTVERRMRRALELMKHSVRPGDREQSVTAHMLGHAGCRAFTSGCTMRLMGIGETSEAQADMLLCPALTLDGKALPHGDLGADVFVSNPLHGSPHILTMDYLLHRAPCVLMMKEQRIRFHAAAAASRTFEFVSAEMVGGAFRVPMRVGGALMHIVLDTGASAPLSLSPSVAQRVERCGFQGASPGQITQVGVNGERVCSNVFHTDVCVGTTLAFARVAILVNDTAVHGADGYAGMGFLRTMDLWFEQGRVGVRRSGLELKVPSVNHTGFCKGLRPPACLGAVDPP